MYTFYGYKKLDIHHIDENKLNNTLSNLIYLTHSEHSILHAKGNKNFLGKHHSEKTKQKISESKKGKPHTEEHKQKLSESIKILHWYNDGIKNYRCKECPEGCIPGRIPFNS